MIKTRDDRLYPHITRFRASWSPRVHASNNSFFWTFQSSIVLWKPGLERTTFVTASSQLLLCFDLKDNLMKIKIFQTLTDLLAWFLHSPSFSSVNTQIPFTLQNWRGMGTWCRFVATDITSENFSIIQYLLLKQFLIYWNSQFFHQIADKGTPIYFLN